MRVWIGIVVGLAACSSSDGQAKNEAEQVAPPARPQVPADAADVKPPDPYAVARFEMVETTIAARGITDPRVIAAMKITPRHEFVPPAIRHQAYDDRPLPIGFDLTISQPFIVATMTQAARVKAGDRVLEIGTGSGYQAAVLAMMGAKVYTIEIHEELAKRTKRVLERTGFREVQLRTGDGYFGWSDAAPFDAILITCAVPAIPPPLLAQLKLGGRIVAPIGDDFEQELVVLTKTPSGVVRESLMGVRFGLMHGEIDNRR